jgi:Icc-related predicted phosphoesterase
VAAMLFAATSDVHSPRYLLEFVAALGKHEVECGNVKLFFFAGDMVEKGNVSALEPVVRAVRNRCPGSRIVAVFGNEEYMDRESLFVKRYREIIWLNDSYMTFEYGDIRVAVYGTRGAIDKPTKWQQRHIPNIRLIYAERVRRLERNVMELKRRGYRVIVLMHYAPTFLTVEGEDPRIWPYLASKLMEQAIRRTQPDIVIHGHAHHSKRLEARIGETIVVNVAFPARRDVYFSNLPMSPGRLS